MADTTLSLLEDYRIATLQLREALIQNNAPLVLTTVLQQNDILQKICFNHKGVNLVVRSEASVWLGDLVEQMNENQLLLSQASDTLNACLRDIARRDGHWFVRQQV